MSAAGAALIGWAQPICNRYEIPHLAPYLPTVIQSLGFWLSLQYLSALVSPRLFPKTWATLKPATRTSWHVHWVAFCHAIVITPLTARIWYKVYLQGGMDGTHPLARNRVYGFDPEAANVYAITLGYFIWDSVVSLLVCARALRQPDRALVLTLITLFFVLLSLSSQYDGPAFVAHGLVAMTAFVFVFVRMLPPQLAPLAPAG